MPYITIDTTETATVPRKRLTIVVQALELLTLDCRICKGLLAPDCLTCNALSEIRETLRRALVAMPLDALEPEELTPPKPLALADELPVKMSTTHCQAPGCGNLIIHERLREWQRKKRLHEVTNGPFCCRDCARDFQRLERKGKLDWCQWDPENNTAAKFKTERSKRTIISGCGNTSVFVVKAHNGATRHLCRSCADLPQLVKHEAKRTLLFFRGPGAIHFRNKS